MHNIAILCIKNHNGYDNCRENQKSPLWNLWAYLYHFIKEDYLNIYLEDICYLEDNIDHAQHSQKLD